MGQGDAVAGESVCHVITGAGNVLEDTIKLGNSREVTLLSAGGGI